jgi:outer membrane PBP1 activator LpoA protein
MLMKGFATIVTVVTLAGALAGCASQATRTEGQIDPFQQGDWAAAVADYEQRVQRLPSVDSDPDLVLRLALARAVDGHLGHDINRARELLQELARSSSVRGEAAALLSILDSLAGAEQRVAVVEPQAARVIEVQLGLIELLSTHAEETADLGQTIQDRDQSIEELRKRLRIVEREAQRLARELAELKSIDLSHPD